jgi:hypothetical protein
MGCPLAVADATAAARLQSVHFKIHPPGVHGQGPRVARAKTWVKNI